MPYYRERYTSGELFPLHKPLPSTEADAGVWREFVYVCNHHCLRFNNLESVSSIPHPYSIHLAIHKSGASDYSLWLHHSTETRTTQSLHERQKHVPVTKPGRKLHSEQRQMLLRPGNTHWPIPPFILPKDNNWVERPRRYHRSSKVSCSFKSALAKARSQ